MNEKDYLKRLNKDIEEFMNSSRIFGYEAKGELSDKACQVFIAFKLHVGILEAKEV
jgi:hypothetical protein